MWCQWSCNEQSNRCDVSDHVVPKLEHVYNVRTLAVKFVLRTRDHPKKVMWLLFTFLFSMCTITKLHSFPTKWHNMAYLSL